MQRKVLTSVLMILALTLTTLFAVFPVPSPVPIPPDQYGPRLDKFRWIMIRGRDIQYAALISRDVDFMTLLTPDLVESAVLDEKFVSYEPLHHYFRFCINIHRGLYNKEYPLLGEIENQLPYHPLSDVNFRHALAHAFPREYVTGTIFRFIYDPLVTPITAAYGEWHNAGVDDHPYNTGDPITSPAGEHSTAGILKAAGYVYDPTWGGGVGNWICPGDYDQDTNPGTIWVDDHYEINDSDDYVQSHGGPLTPSPAMVLLMTPRTVVPAETDTGLAFIAGLHQAGLNNIVMEEIESTPKFALMYDAWNYDMAWHITTQRPDPSWLYDRYHTSQNYLGSYAPNSGWWDAEVNGTDAAGVTCPSVDKLIEIMLTTADHSEAVWACRKIQELLRGGTKANPLPIPAPTNDDWWEWSIPDIYVGSRNAYLGSQPELKGLVKYKAAATSNEWSYFTMYWDTPDGNRLAGPGTVADKGFYRPMSSPPGTLNPVSAITDYSWGYINRVLEGLVTRNPYTLQDEPNMAEKWGFLPWTYDDTGEPNGTIYWYQLRPDLYWQDGYEYTVEDAKFTLDFMKDWEVPRTWKEMKEVDHVTAISENRTLQVFVKGWWSFYWLHQYSGYAAELPPQIWNRTWTDVTELMAYAPEFEAYGTDMAPGYPAGPWAADVATNLIGTGEWILTDLHPTYEYAEYTANRHDWRKTQEVYDRLGYLFWRVGDTNKDEIVDMGDIGTIGFHFYTWNATWPGESPNANGYNPDADVTSASYLPPEGRIDGIDLSTAAKYNGESKFVPST